jgi:hypothetical protein
MLLSWPKRKIYVLISLKLFFLQQMGNSSLLSKINEDMLKRIFIHKTRTFNLIVCSYKRNIYFIISNKILLRLITLLRL